MVLSIRWWAHTFIVGLALFGFMTAASAAAVADPGISSVSASALSSTTPGATGVSVDIDFTTTAAIPAGVGFEIQAIASDCFSGDWNECNFDFSDASIADAPAGSLEAGETWVMWINSAEMAAGNYSITLSGLTLPAYNGAYRFYMVTPASDTSGIASNTFVGTVSGPFIVGTVLVSGNLADSDGDPVQSYVEVRNADWSVYGSANSDNWGFYAARNPGFSSGDTVTVTAHPSSDSGLFVTSAEFAYAGSPVSQDITVNSASKTVTVSVTYADTGDAVTTASANANSPKGWAGGNTDSSGIATFKVAGGSWNVCLGDQWTENGRVKRDWYSPMGQECQYINFVSDESTESASLEFVVNRADASVTGIFKNPDGSFPEQGAWVSFWNENYWFGGDVNSETGVFEIAVVGGNSNEVQATSRGIQKVGSTNYSVQYNPNSSAEKKYYWDETSVSVETDEAKDLGIVILAEKDVTATITVVDENGAPVPEVFVDAWQDKGGWSNAQTDSSGQATMYLYAGRWNIQPSFWNRTDLIYVGQPYQPTVESGDTISKTFSVVATTVNVTVNAFKPDGKLASDEYGWANCWNQSGYGFGGSMNNGIATFGAVGGDFSCGLWMNNSTYQPGGEQFVTFVDGEAKTLEFSLKEKNSTLVVNVKDQDNNLVENANGWVFANSPTGGWLSQRLDSDGTLEMFVAEGTYFVGVWFDPGSSYISSQGGPGVGLTVAENESATKTLTVFSVTGELVASAVDNNGDPVANAWVWCSNWPEFENGELRGDFDGGRVIDSGAPTGADGVAVVGLVTGHRYECGAGTPPDLGLIGPEAERVNLTSKDAVEKTFEFQAATSTITGTLSLADSDATINRAWCGGWAEEGYSSFGESSGGTYELAVIPGTWHIWCGTDIPNDDGGIDFYDPQQDLLVNVTEDGQIKTKNIVLTKSLFAVPQSFSQTFDSAVANTLVMGDGTTLNIPAASIQASGNVTITAEPALDATRTDDIPFGFPWNFEAYDEDGTLISGDFLSTVTLDVPYDAELLDEFGIDPEDLLPKWYNEETGVWETVDNVSLNEDDALVTFTLAHFSEVGLVYNSRSIVEAPKKPGKLAAKKIGRKSARLTWKAPAGSVVSKYRVQLRVRGVAKKGQWRKFTNVSNQTDKKVKRKVVKKLKPGTQYQFRVKSQNSAGTSKWTKWKAFTTVE